MTDVVVTVPRDRWKEWLAEGDLPDEPPTGQTYYFSVGRIQPPIEPGERVYVVAHGRLRGYAPLVRLDVRRCYTDDGESWYTSFDLVRRGGAVAVTIPESIRGFPGWRYRWWSREDEAEFPDWKKP